MNIYHAWCDLKPGVSDIAFSESAAKYLRHLQTKGMIESWRITRRKLGLAQPELGEFHVMMKSKTWRSLTGPSTMWRNATSRPRAFILGSTPWRKTCALRCIATFPIRNASEALSGSS